MHLNKESGLDQKRRSYKLCVSSQATVDGGLAPSLAAASLRLEEDGADDGAAMAPDPHPVPAGCSVDEFPAGYS